MAKVALISGITGQDGSYLTELLLGKGYIVHGIIRRSSSFNTFRIDHLYSNKEILNKTLFLHYGDLTDSSNLNRIVERTQPDEIYNLGAQSHVHVSFEVPEYTAEVDGIGTLRFLDAIGGRAKLKPNSTRPVHQSCLDWFRRSLKQKTLHFTPAAPMRQRSSTPTGLLKTTGKPIIYLPATASFSTMNLKEGEKHLLPGRFQSRYPRLCLDFKINY